MSYSYTSTETTAFTVTHAKHLASKVATDLKRLQRFYKKPTDKAIDDYEAEMIELLKHGYLDRVEYGFWRNERWIEPTLQYTARELAGDALQNDDPGKIRPGANVNGASFHSYLTYSAAWWKLSDQERHAFKRSLPFSRQGADEPGVDGIFESDLTYSSGGRALNRRRVRSL